MGTQDILLKLSELKGQIVDGEASVYGAASKLNAISKEIKKDALKNGEQTIALVICFSGVVMLAGTYLCMGRHRLNPWANELADWGFDIYNGSLLAPAQ